MTDKWLIPVDDSENALRAVDYAIDACTNRTSRPEILLVNVQHPLTGDVAAFVNREVMQDFHREQGEKALARACARLDGAGVPYTHHILLGEAAVMICEFAKAKACTQIVMGSRGLGSIAGMLLGSVATKVAHLGEVPLVLVK
jgi:nucleotide-binding universal stress UspA family protein